MKNHKLKLKKDKILLINESFDDDIVDHKPKQNRNLTIPWVEKYRPRNIDDLAVNQITYNKIKKIIDDKDMPNIIITGLPGIGKTTTILCIARALLGKYCGQGVLELNASDDRGIKAVQDLIIYFCKKKFEIRPTGDKTYANHKIILLDEADNMTKKAQQLVNNLMAKYHKTTRFAFTCNNSSDIIEAIQSKCIIFRYKRLSNKQIFLRLDTICGKENIIFTPEGIDAIIVTSQGDMRQAINNLQLVYNGNQNDTITYKSVYKLCDTPHPIIIENIFFACNKGNTEEALILLNKLRENGFSNSDISLSMMNTLKSSKLSELGEDVKIKYLIEIGNTALNISKGVDSLLQLTGCITKLCK
jgi:replication factor C subunit 2/4